MARLPLYHCEKLRASLTVKQCEANKARTGLMVVFQCQDCAGLGKAVELAARVKPAVCKCGGIVHVRGMCRTCYYKFDNAKRAERKKQAAVVTAAPVEPVVTPPVITPPAVRVNPLLPVAGYDRLMVLDLREHSDLYDWMMEAEVKAEHVIELLCQCYAGTVIGRAA